MIARSRLGAAITLLVVAATAVGMTSGAGSAGAAAPSHAYRADDYANGQAMSILPPGENGLVNATDLVKYELTKTRPANSQDQLGKYENLLYATNSLTDSNLGQYYNDESFGVAPGDVTRTEVPAAGVTIYRDQNDVPHIYGTSDQTMAFGAGYAQAEDRLFLMDTLRHYGEGTLASFLGGSCQFEQMDHDQLLLSAYTPAQAVAQVNNLPAEYGAMGTTAKNMLYAYVNGINAWINHALVDPLALPADYAAAAPSLLPTHWGVQDVVAIAGLIGGIFGRGGGSEVSNANLLEYLQQQFGAGAGAADYAQFKNSNDPLAPTTVVDKTFPYEIPGTVNPSTTALPDYGHAISGGPTDTTANCNLTAPNATATGIIAALQAFPKHMSNALVINGSKTASGHPIAVFGPQVSYYAPQILALEDLHSPDYAAEGASFPGTGVVELGRGEDYAWSATSAGSDLIDQRLEKVCNPTAGAAPAAQGTYYMYLGKCTPMVAETFTETALPKVGGLGGPAVISHKIYLTVHGIVQGWTTSGGKPVAIVNQRSTFGHDVDSVVGFLGFGMPSKTYDVTSWMANAANILYTFNWFYVDDTDTGYFVSGLDPVRPTNVDPTLPTWGTGISEWQGYLTPAQHVHEADPPQGFFVSWNNKPAPGFAAADDQYGYGQVYRSIMLVNQIKAQFAAHPSGVTRANIVQAMETAASQDLDGLTEIPLLLQYASGRAEPPGVQAMLSILQTWVDSGAHRLKANPSDTQYAQAAAVAISDQLIPNVIRAIYDPVLASGGVGSNGYNALPMGWVDYPHGHLGSSYDGGWEGYLDASLEQLLGQNPVDGFGPAITSIECGGGAATCGAAIDAALVKTFNGLASANDSLVPASWTQSSASAAAGVAMPVYDDIQFSTLGVVGQPAIDWQNRPTFQQVIEFPAHRPR